MERTSPRDAAVATPAPARPASDYWRLLLFIGPLIFTGLMMTTDTPVVNAVIARLPNAETELAALVVAFSLALVYEAPHVSMLEIGTALTTTRQALATLRRFYLRVALVVGVIGAAVIFTPLYDLLLHDAMNIPPEVAAAARPAIAILLIWPLPIGWRRLHQGALIRNGFSRAVGAGATVRIATLVGGVFVLAVLFGQTLGGATIGAIAMLASVTAESLYTHRTAARLLTSMAETDPQRPALSFSGIWEYYLPLAGTSLLSTISRPLLSAGIAASAIGGVAGADSALAAFGVGWAIVFLLNGGTFNLWPVAISWDNEPDPAQRRRGIVLLMGVGVALSLLLALIAFTPAIDWLLGTLYAVTPDVAAAARPVVRLLIPLPTLFIFSGMLRGKLINRRQPRAVSRAQMIDLATMVLALIVGLNWPDPATAPHGATLGTLAALITYIVDAAVLAITLRSLSRRALA